MCPIKDNLNNLQIFRTRIVEISDHMQLQYIVSRRIVWNYVQLIHISSEVSKYSKLVFVLHYFVIPHWTIVKVPSRKNSFNVVDEHFTQHVTIFRYFASICCRFSKFPQTAKPMLITCTKFPKSLGKY